MEKVMYYTFQVTLHRKAEGTDQPEAYELKDCTSERIIQLRKEVWAIGFSVNHTAICREIISPFAIKTVLIITQPHKYN